MNAIKEEAHRIVAGMTLREKAALCSGRGYWHTKAVKRLELPRIMMADGPHGLRRQGKVGNRFGIGGSAPATCFPTASALACSFDPRLLREIGAAIAEEALDQGVSIVLGPGVNIKRSPLGGRNFEYFSEDPQLSGELGAAFVRGVQENVDGSPTGVGACVKHFAANSQERFRMVSDSVVDEQTLREIYFPAFEKVVKEARPAAVMCSYNLINGTYASESGWLLTDVLRGEWGYEGLVVSDWGATADRVRGLAAGLDLEMPGVGGYSARRIMKAVREGMLAEDVLNASAERVAALALTYAPARPCADAEGQSAGAGGQGADACEQGAGGQGADAGGRRGQGDMYERHHALARRAAASSAVLLKNDRALLPIVPVAAAPEHGTELHPAPTPASGIRLAVIGEFAKKPRYQGAGSSFVNPTRIDTAWDELVKDFPDAAYARGYDLADEKENVPQTDKAAAPQAPPGGLGKKAEKLIEEAAAAAAAADIAVVFAGLPEGFESEGYDRASLAMPRSHDALIRAVCAANSNTTVVIQAGSPVDLSAAKSAAAILYAWLGGQAGGGAIADLITGRANPSGRLAETFPLRIEDTPCHGNFSTESRTVKYSEGTLVGRRYYEAKGIPVTYPYGHGLSYGKEVTAPTGNATPAPNSTLHLDSPRRPCVPSQAPEPQRAPSTAPAPQAARGNRGSNPTPHAPAFRSYTANSTLGDMRRTPVGFLLYAAVRFALTLVYGTGAAGRRMARSIVDETPLRAMSPMSGGLLPRAMMDAIVRLANIGPRSGKP
ncbi:MAG: glycoside hydrolase family 3 C-terminal domain-containing protein [Clostridiales Family XIII bacterium]|nr:glycoside hydrolase family 3 C-terminal domain-containing protein [Clostridiales Family XIII bacterium]